MVSFFLFNNYIIILNYALNCAKTLFSCEWFLIIKVGYIF